MLEAQIAADIARGIVEMAAKAGAVVVKSAEVRIGALRVIDEPALLAALAGEVAGTVAAGAVFTITRAPAQVRCRACGEVYAIEVGQPATYDCPACGDKHHDMVSGMEIDLVDVQGYVPSPEGSSMADKLAKAVEDALGPVESADA